VTSQARDANELAGAAARLRELVPRFRETPVTEFVPIAVAGLLDAIADSLSRGDPLRDAVTQRALELARHVPRADRG
jgi:transposase